MGGDHQEVVHTTIDVVQRVRVDGRMGFERADLLAADETVEIVQLPGVLGESFERLRDAGYDLYVLSNGNYDILERLPAGFVRVEMVVGVDDRLTAFLVDVYVVVVDCVIE